LENLLEKTAMRLTVNAIFYINHAGSRRRHLPRDCRQPRPQYQPGWLSEKLWPSGQEKIFLLTSSFMGQNSRD
jgi:hypothetical protein